MTIDYDDYIWGDEDDDEKIEKFDGNTDLVYALRDKNYILAKELIEQGADIENVNNNGYTPLSEASESGRLDTVKFLINNGAEFSEDDYSALERAIAFDNFEVTKYLIDLDKIKITETDILEQLKLTKHIKVIDYLLGKGHLDIISKKNQNKFLKMALRSDSVDYLSYLVDKLKINVSIDVYNLSNEIEKTYEELSKLKIGKEELLHRFFEILNHLIIDQNFNIDNDYFNSSELIEKINKITLYRDLSKKIKNKDIKDSKTKI